MNKLAVLCIMAALLPSCATKIEGLYVKDDFKAPQIQRGGMIAGGVVAEPGKFDLPQSNDFSNAMLAAVKSEREYIKVGPASTLINAVGEARYTEIMNKFSKADLDEATLGQLAAKLKETRYVAFAKIDANTTEKRERETDAREYKNANGETVREAGKIYKMQDRTLHVTMTIYDLESKSAAFSGQVTKMREATNTFQKSTITSIVSIVNAVKGKSAEETFPTPDAPQTRDVLRDAFVGFSENLPKTN